MALLIAGLMLMAMPGSDLGPSELVGRLGSARKAEREEAARTLEEIGAEAVPALRRASREADDAEVRARASDALDRIEARLLTGPSMVSLDFDGVPLEEAVFAISKRSGHALALDPEAGDALRNRRVRLVEPGPVPFWEAVGLLGRAGHVRHDPSAIYRARGREAPITLVDGEPPQFVAYDGPFRVHLVEFRLHGDVDVSRRAEDQRPPRRILTAVVQVFAEPGLRLRRDGLPRIDAADEKGRPLTPPSPDEERPSPARRTRVIREGEPAMLQYDVPLGPPAEPSSRLREFRGTIPLVVSRRRPDPLEVALSDAAGKTYRREGATLRFEAIGTPSLPLAKQLSFVLNIKAGAEVPPDLGDLLDIIDTEGKPIRWGVRTVGRMPNGEVKMRVYVPRGSRPAKLRLYDAIATRAEVSFAFRNVPLP